MAPQVGNTRNEKPWDTIPIVDSQSVLVLSIIGSLCAIVLLSLVIVMLLNWYQRRRGSVIWLTTNNHRLLRNHNASANASEQQRPANAIGTIRAEEALRELEQLATGYRLQQRIVIDRQSLTRLVGKVTFPGGPSSSSSSSSPSLSAAAAAVCSICLDSIDGTIHGDSVNNNNTGTTKSKHSTRQLRQIQRCGHWFHRDCIDRWLVEYSALCPVCKQLSVDYSAPNGVVQSGSQLIFLRTTSTATNHQSPAATTVISNRIEIGSVPRQRRQRREADRRHGWRWLQHWVGHDDCENNEIANQDRRQSIELQPQPRIQDR